MKKSYVNIYDFDGTIYNGDSTIDFYKFCLKKNKKIILLLPIQLWYMFLYKIKIKTKKEFKEKFFSFLNYIDDLEYIIDEFWNIYSKKIKKFYLEKNHSNDIIISASPLFLIKPIGNRLKVLDVIATNISKTGKIIGNNCYGEEKVILFKNKYKNILVNNVYTDSLSDIPIMLLGKNSYLVKRDKITLFKEGE